MDLFRHALTLISFAAVVVALSATPAAASSLCGPLNPPSTEAEGDWRARESDFSKKNFTDAMNYFDGTLPRALHSKAKTEDVLDSEVFVISYPNSMTSIKGYVLRQDALLRMLERDLVVEKNQRGRASKAEVGAANARFTEAKNRFCEFLKAARFND